MLWSGSSPLSALRDGIWGFLLLAGVAWLAIAWSVLRLEPADIATVAGPVVLFAAVTEIVRAFAGSRTWWLNAGMAVLFAATAALLISDRGDSWTTPTALIGWYLMVRGAADVAISMMTRETDRIWGLLTVVGLAELGLGFFAAGSFSRTAEMAAVILGGAATVRGVADLVASLRLREVSASTRAGRLLELPGERAIGVAGYSAGMIDFEEAPEQAARARHRAEPRATAGMTSLAGTTSAAGMTAVAGTSSVAGMHDLSGSQPGRTDSIPADFTVSNPHAGTGRPASFHDEVLRTTADLDAMLALAGVTGAAIPGAAHAAEAEQVEVPDTAEGAELPGHQANEQQPAWAAAPEAAGWASGGAGPATPNANWAPGNAGPAAQQANWAPGNASWQNPAGATTATYQGGAGAPANAASNFGPPANAAGNFGTAPGTFGPPPNPASGFGPTAHGSAGYQAAPANAGSGFGTPATGTPTTGNTTIGLSTSGAPTTGPQAAGLQQAGDDASVPLLDPAARAARPAMPGMDDTSIIARRLMD